MIQNERVGIVGLGFLGRGIAACLLAHGQQVVAHARSNDARTEAEEYIDTAMRELVEYAGFPETIRQSWREEIQFIQGFAEFRDASFVIESVVEDVEVKNEVFDALEAVLAADVPIASNTSSLSVTLLAERRRHPERILGMHWAEPAYATRFLELIRGDKTSDAAFERAVALGRRVGKQPSLVQKDVPAFIVNRLGYAMLREALHLLDSGVADAATIDRSFRNAVGLWAGFSGPLRWIDLTGGPALYGKTMSNVLPTLSNADSISGGMRQMMESGDKGVVNGRGFYRYCPEDKQLWEERFRRSVWQAWRWSEELGLGEDA